jgi:hypothetical protein
MSGKLMRLRKPFEDLRPSLALLGKLRAQKSARCITLLLSALLIATTACSTLNLIPSKIPAVIIASPPSGSVLQEGDNVVIQSTVTGSTGIIRVELLVDNTVVSTDSLPSVQAQTPVTLTQKWKATPGTHILLVRASDAAGKESGPVAVTVTVLPGATPTATLAPTLVLPTASPTVTSTVCTDAAVFVADVSVPDGTVFAAGQTFNKTWRVRNTGCPWVAGYQLVFVSGEAMSTVKSVPLPDTATGATADLSVSMTAPAAPGLHNGTWRLRNPKGTLFGTIVTVKINVPGLPIAANTPLPFKCNGTPNISSFTATQTILVPLGTTTLKWGPVTNADSVEIDQGVGEVGSPGSLTVTPAGAVTYTMTANCGSNTATAQVKIMMPFAVIGTLAYSVPGDYSGACPATFGFTANITASDAGTVTFKWESSDGSNDSGNLNLTFGAAGPQSVSTTWKLGTPGQTITDHWMRVHTLSPTDVTSNNAIFTLRCN